MLAERADTLDEPYTGYLGGKVRELRFHLLAQLPRITYDLATQGCSLLPLAGSQRSGATLCARGQRSRLRAGS